MLTGKNPLRLPAYAGTLPAVVLIQCGCFRRYVVFTGIATIDEGAQLVRRQAEARGAVFVDARVEPFLMCECGEVLDFTPGGTVEAVM